MKNPFEITVPAAGMVLFTVRDSVTGKVKSQVQVPNLITQRGHQRYAFSGAGVSGGPAAPTGVKCGTGTTAEAATGTGSAVVSYVAGSNQVFDTGFPAMSLAGAKARATYQATIPAGKGTTTSLYAEVVLVNDASTDAASTSANTYARVVLASADRKAKSATDEFVFVWTHDVGAA